MCILLVISAEGVVTTSFPTYLQNIGLTKNILRVVQKAVLLTDVSYSTQIPRTRPLTLEDRVNFLPLSEPNLTDNTG